MDDTRFLSVLNAALAASDVDLSAPAPPGDTAQVEAWAGFLARCIAEGVSIADPRWRALELRRGGDGTGTLALARSDAPPMPAKDEPDFRVGLSLLMSMLGHEDLRR